MFLQLFQLPVAVKGHNLLGKGLAGKDLVDNYHSIAKTVYVCKGLAVSMTNPGEGDIIPIENTLKALPYFSPTCLQCQERLQIAVPAVIESFRQSYDRQLSFHSSSYLIYSL